MRAPATVVTPLSRHDVETYTDKPTNSVVLKYVGRHLAFFETLYGYPEGVFFAANLDELPLPEKLLEIAERWRIDLDSILEVKGLRKAVAECLAAQALIEAPEFLAEVAEPDAFWHDWDRRDLERRHRIALAKVVRHSRLAENEVRLRASGLTSPSIGIDSVSAQEGFMPPPVPVFAERPVAVETDCPPPAPSPPVNLTVQTSDCDPSPSPEPDDEEGDEEDANVGGFLPDSVTVIRARVAMKLARENEVPQRLPGGARRALRPMLPGVYVEVAGQLYEKSDLCAAMNDARNRGRKDRESSVIDWDGEWPVVVRRYGRGGRVIYQVETALRRNGIEMPG